MLHAVTYSIRCRIIFFYCCCYYYYHHHYYYYYYYHHYHYHYYYCYYYYHHHHYYYYYYYYYGETARSRALASLKDASKHVSLEILFPNFSLHTGLSNIPI
jgi:hypothetical protein